MEGYFKEMPKFQTPEEELDYLRAHVAKREQELIDIGHFENAGESAVKEVIAEYKQVPASRAMERENIVSETQAEGIALKLKPEAHDTVMEELLGVLITKGIRNALSVVEAMGSPHIDDDFHRL